MAGVNQNVSKMETFFEKYVPHFLPIFEKKFHPMRPVEGLKLFLDFLCNTGIISELYVIQCIYIDKRLFLAKFDGRD